jgi:hypothetical protein
VRSDDDIGHLAAAGDQDTDLAVDLPGEFRKLAGQVVGDDLLRRDAPTVKLPDPLDFGRREAGQIAMYLLYGLSLLMGSPDSLLEFVRVDPLFHPVEEGGPGIRPEGDGPLFCLLRPAGGTNRFRLADLHDPLEEMAAGRALIFVDRHRLLRESGIPCNGNGVKGRNEDGRALRRI